jgi:hypothetical protein
MKLMQLEVQEPSAFEYRQFQTFSALHLCCITYSLLNPPLIGFSCHVWFPVDPVYGHRGMHLVVDAIQIIRKSARSEVYFRVPGQQVGFLSQKYLRFVSPSIVIVPPVVGRQLPPPKHVDTLWFAVLSAAQTVNTTNPFSHPRP